MNGRAYRVRVAWCKTYMHPRSAPTKLLDVEFGISGILRGFELKMGKVSNGRFAARVARASARTCHAEGDHQPDAAGAEGVAD